MSDYGDPKVGAFLTFLDMSLREDADKPERQHAYLVHLRKCLDSRIAAVADAARRRTRGKTPPPRRQSQPILPRAPEPAWSRQATNPTERKFSRDATAVHNPQQLLEQARELDIENRDTPVVESQRLEEPIVEWQVDHESADKR